MTDSKSDKTNKIILGKGRNMKKTIIILFVILSNLVFADIQSDVKNNNLEGVKKYLEKEEKTYYYIDTLNELLSDAVYYGSINIEKLLLEKGASYNEALLRSTSGRKDIEKSKKLLEKGANPNYRDESGYTTLHIASQDNKVEFVKLLLKYGGDPSIKNNDGKTAYNLAAEYGYTEVLRELPKPHGVYILRSMVYNFKNSLFIYLNWGPKELHDLYLLTSLTMPLVFIMLFTIELLIKFGLPIILVVYFIKRIRKLIKNKKEKK